ncbi:MAG: AAA family ATPase [Clostridia bacterium]|nr:AAA family ATPase [Clostridia bacterium]
MKITKIEIGHFGKWENFSLDFTDGIQVIYGRNEAGKSTICAFLQAMFYGLPNERKAVGIREDLRKRYAPWDGSPMEGNVFFEHAGRKYVLTRRLGKTRKGDKVSLKDGTTWEELSEIPESEIGRTFFGVGEEAFLKTLFISQLGAAIRSDDEDEILKRLSNLKQSGSEDISYQAAAQALEKAKYELISKSEKAGLIPRSEQEKEQLEFEYKEAVRLSEQYRTDVLCHGELVRLGNQLREEEKTLSKQKELAKEHERFLALAKTEDTRNILLTRKTENESKIANTQKTIEDLKEKLERHLAQAPVSQDELLSLLAMEQEVAEKAAKASEYEKKRQKAEELKGKINLLSKTKTGKIKPLLLLSGAFTLVLGALAGSTISVYLWALSMIGAVLLTAGIFARSRKNTELEEILAQVEILDAELREEQENKEKLEELRSKLFEILSSAGVSEVHELSKRAEEKSRLEAERKTAERELSLLFEAQSRIDADLLRLPEKSETSFSDEAIDYSGAGIEELDALLRENHTKQLENQRTEEAVRYSLEHAFAGTRSADIILTELTQKEEELSEYRFRYDAIVLAQNALYDSYMELKEDFAPVLNERVGEILSELTDGRYSELKISDDYKVMLKEKSRTEPVSAEHLSNGTYDVLYLALRLGIAKVIFPDGIPFIMLDDSFLQLDDARAQRAANYLKTQADAEQIFYFTCHSSQSELFGDEVNRIEL